METGGIILATAITEAFALDSRRREPSRFESFREADEDKRKVDPWWIAYTPGKQSPSGELAPANVVPAALVAHPTVHEIVKWVEREAPDVVSLAAETGIGEESLALRIDSQLNTGVWTGTTFEDRMSHMVGELQKTLVGQMEQSLLQQESYDVFRERILKSMGLTAEAATGPLRKFEIEILTEARLAWNKAMLEANAGEDTALVWCSRLLPTTTPGCAARHGKLIDQELGGETPPRHWGCYCWILTIPNPASADAGRAAAGQSQLSQMGVEQGDWGGEVDMTKESVRPSRFPSFREAVVPLVSAVATGPSRFLSFRQAS